MSDNTQQSDSVEIEIVTFPEFIAHVMELNSEGKFTEAAEYAFNLYNAILADFRENKSADKPSIKKAADAFEPSAESETQRDEILAQVRGIVHSAITQNPELSVLLYEGLKDYAQDHVKVFRDAVLRGYMNEVEDDAEESEYELPMTADELKRVRTMVESFANSAENMLGVKPDIPVKKSGSFAYANPRGYGEDGDAVASKEDNTVRWVYELEGEPIEARTLADVALWHVSDPDAVYTSSDLMKIVRKTHGNKEFSDGWTIEVNGLTLTAKKPGN